MLLHFGGIGGNDVITSVDEDDTALNLVFPQFLYLVMIFLGHQVAKQALRMRQVRMMVLVEKLLGRCQLSGIDGIQYFRMVRCQWSFF